MSLYRVTNSIHRTTVEAVGMLNALNKAHKVLPGNVVLEYLDGEAHIAEAPTGGPWSVDQAEFDLAWDGATDL